MGLNSSFSAWLIPTPYGGALSRSRAGGSLVRSRLEPCCAQSSAAVMGSWHPKATQRLNYCAPIPTGPAGGGLQLSVYCQGKAAPVCGTS